MPDAGKTAYEARMRLAGYRAWTPWHELTDDEREAWLAAAQAVLAATE